MYGTDGILGVSIGRNRLRNTKVGNLYLTFSGNHNILRFNISVDNVVVMRSFQTLGNLNGNAHSFFNGKTAFLFNKLL